MRNPFLSIAKHWDEMWKDFGDLGGEVDKSLLPTKSVHVKTTRIVNPTERKVLHVEVRGRDVYITGDLRELRIDGKLVRFPKEKT